MEIQGNDINTRTFEYTKRKVLKDGTVKEYKYTGSYNVATQNIHCDKTKMRKRITECKDKETLKKLFDYMNELGM